MFKNTQKDIYRELEFMPITLISNKVKVLVIGGGNAGLIKVKTFLKNGCDIEIVALDFIEELYIIKDIKLTKSEYKQEYILNKHIIVIALSREEVIRRIIDDCEKLSKLYINLSNYKEGMVVLPVSRESETLSIAVNTKLGNPTAAIMIADYTANLMSKFDEFILFTSKIRNNLTVSDVNKRQLMKFINSEDFIFYYKKNKHENVLRLFFDEKVIDDIKACLNKI